MQTLENFAQFTLYLPISHLLISIWPSLLIKTIIPMKMTQRSSTKHLVSIMSEESTADLKQSIVKKKKEVGRTFLLTILHHQ